MWAYAGVSVVNAIPSWLGSTMAVNLRIEVSLEEGSEQYNGLIGTIIEYFTKSLGIPRPRVSVKSPIPAGSGLKSSSAVAVALIEAIKNKYGLSYIDTPKLASELSIKAGVSITGAYDDSTASYHGGVSFTNNRENKLLDLREPPKDLTVIILARGGRPRIDPNALRRFEDLFREIFNIAMRGDILTAMRLNGIAVAEILGYDIEPIRAALRLGALAAGVSGNGPSIFAITKKGEEGPIIDLLSRFDRVLVTEPANITRL
ncbi:MAG TPA: shikimate kinase [Sulfolobales archaeon]|nr:shikimate kinase [Sulfolobales archaeon]